MGKLIIKREKVMIGFAVKMKCYVNGKVICELKNGEKSLVKWDMKSLIQV